MITITNIYTRNTPLVLMSVIHKKEIELIPDGEYVALQSVDRPPPIIKTRLYLLDEVITKGEIYTFINKEFLDNNNMKRNVIKGKFHEYFRETNIFDIK